MVNDPYQLGGRVTYGESAKYAETRERYEGEFVTSSNKIGDKSRHNFLNHMKTEEMI